MTFQCSQVVGSVDRKVRCVDVETLHYCLEELRLVNNTFLHEVEELILLCDTLLSEVVKLASQLVLQLSFFRQELGLISVIEVSGILGEWMEHSGLNPGSDSVSCDGCHFYLGDLASSEQRESSWVILQLGPVLNSWDPD